MVAHKDVVLALVGVSAALSGLLLVFLGLVVGTYVSSVERGERNISLLNILKLAQALKVDPADPIRGLRAPNQ